MVNNNHSRTIRASVYTHIVSERCSKHTRALTGFFSLAAAATALCPSVPFFPSCDGGEDNDKEGCRKRQSGRDCRCGLPSRLRPRHPRLHLNQPAGLRPSLRPSHFLPCFSLPPYFMSSYSPALPPRVLWAHALHRRPSCPAPSTLGATTS